MVGGTFARHVICVNLAQPKKAYSPIVVTELGISMAAKYSL